VNARTLYQAGQLDEAIEALGAEVRDNPSDAQRRTFLFELLCFAGRYDRAEKQLAVLGQGGKEAQMGALVYQSALHAERLRQDMFERQAFPGSAAPRPVAGTLNGRRFEALQDADPRIGARLEVFAAGQYTWLPFEQIASVRMQPPARLRDLLWAPALVRTAAAYKGVELGEVLVPALAPLTWRHTDGEVRLGRVTEWAALEEGGEAPVGQKMLLVDGEEFPLLELRELVVDAAPGASAA
jgi:type VI secretion system protein ImpE